MPIFLHECLHFVFFAGDRRRRGHLSYCQGCWPLSRMQTNSGCLHDRSGREVIRSICSSCLRSQRHSLLRCRMLLVTKSHHEPDDMLPDRENTMRMSLCKESVSPWTGASQFLPTTSKIIQFSNAREPKVRRPAFPLAHSNKRNPLCPQTVERNPQ